MHFDVYIKSGKETAKVLDWGLNILICTIGFIWDFIQCLLSTTQLSHFSIMRVKFEDLCKVKVIELHIPILGATHFQWAPFVCRYGILPTFSVGITVGSASSSTICWSYHKKSAFTSHIML